MQELKEMTERVAQKRGLAATEHDEPAAATPATPYRPTEEDADEPPKPALRTPLGRSPKTRFIPPA
jgi:hypothetical protein